MDQPRKALVITASARGEGSITRQLASDFLEQLRIHHPDLKVSERDVSRGIPFVDEKWVNANFTQVPQRDEAQRAALAYSDTLVDEVKQADILLIATPLYNFSVPATLKAWIDMVARVGMTFNYTSDGPVGLLENKKAYVVIASGGTQLGSEIDFASGYLRHVLGFIGIHDVEFVSAERFNPDNEQALNSIRHQINQLATQAV